MADTAALDAQRQVQQALVEGRSDPLEPLSSLAPKTPRALEVAIRRLMAVRKTERTPSADEALKALEAIRVGVESGRKAGLEAAAKRCGKAAYGANADPPARGCGRNL